MNAHAHQPASEWFFPARIGDLPAERRTWPNPGPIHCRRACERIGDDSGAFGVRYHDGLDSTVVEHFPEFRIQFRTKLAGMRGFHGDMLTVVVAARAAAGWVRIESVEAIEHGALADAKFCAELREETERRLVDARIWPEAK